MSSLVLTTTKTQQMELTNFHSFKVFWFSLCVITLFPELVVSRTRHYTFNVR